MEQVIKLVIATLLMVLGCAGNPIQNATDPGQGPVPVTSPPIKYILPDDPGITVSKDSIHGIIFREYSNYGRVAITNVNTTDKLYCKKTAENTLEITREETIAGTVQKTYIVKYQSDKNGNNQTEVLLQPVSYSTTRKGLISTRPFPAFTENQLADYLQKGILPYTFDVDSPYNTESVYSNFTRSLKRKEQKDGYKDSVTGKVFKHEFLLPIKNNEIPFFLETVPYRNGTKAIFRLTITGFQTAPNTVDFDQILTEVKTQLQKIVAQ
jgi:hypothetical protein